MFPVDNPDNPDKKRKADDDQDQRSTKRYRTAIREPTPEEVRELQIPNEQLASYVQSRTLDWQGFQFVPQGIFVEPEKTVSPTDHEMVSAEPVDPPVKGFGPLHLEEEKFVPAQFEEFVREKEHKDVWYEVDDTYQGEYVELTEEELASLKTDKQAVVFAPLLKSSLLDGQRNDTVNTPLSLVFHFIDVGQGSGTLVKCPHGETILIDLGTSKATASSDRSKSGEVGDVETKLVDFVSTNATKIDYLVVSHSDQDHISFINKLGSSVKIDKVLLGGPASDYKEGRFTTPFTGFLVKQETARQKRLREEKKALDGSSSSGDEDEPTITKTSVVKDSLINNGAYYTEAPDLARDQRKIQAKDVDIWIISANAKAVDKGDLVSELGVSKEDASVGEAANTASIVVLFEYKGKRVLISADATFSTDYHILKTSNPWHNNLKCYAISGGHHGSRQSFSVPMLKALDPEWIYFSADMKDRFMHPEWTLVKRIDANCKKIFDRPAWGPHGVVVGDKTEFTPNLLNPMDESFKNLQKMKNELALGFPDSGVGYRHALVGAALEFIRRRNEQLQQERTGVTTVASTASTSGALTETTDNVQDRAPVRWWVDIIIEVESWLVSLPKGIEGAAFLEAMTESVLPCTSYWAHRFQDIEEEAQRVSAITEFKKKAYWHWFTTEANFFTTLESANSGVYWRLEIDSNGKPHTDRT